MRAKVWKVGVGGMVAIEDLSGWSGVAFVEGAATRVKLLLHPVRYRRKLAFAVALCRLVPTEVVSRLSRDLVVDLDLYRGGISACQFETSRNSYMSRQIVRASERFAASWTCERLFAGVRANMTLEVLQSLEQPTARKKRADIGLQRSAGVAGDGVSGEEGRREGGRDDPDDGRFLRIRVGGGATFAVWVAVRGVDEEGWRLG